MILYFATDLLWASKIKGVADALGLPCRPVRTVEMLEARLADTEPTAILLDLTTPETAMGLIARLRDDRAGPKERAIRVIAFGPHVEKDALQAARNAGADEVLTRGALDHHMEEILLKLAARA
jgi:CheY-like chemotaxis protein